MVPPVPRMLVQRQKRWRDAPSTARESVTREEVEHTAKAAEDTEHHCRTAQRPSPRGPRRFRSLESHRGRREGHQRDEEAAELRLGQQPGTRWSRAPHAPNSSATMKVKEATTRASALLFMGEG